MEFKMLKVSELEQFSIREVRQDIVEKLKERIEKDGYNNSRPLSVVEKDGKYLIADGNHRYEAIKNMDIDVPCAIYEDDIYTLATRMNQDEDTYAPMDLFDWLDIIGKMKGEGYKQTEISKKLNWSTQKLSVYFNVINKISTEILKNIKSYQLGRVDAKSTSVDFNFTEGWFRDSGLYDLKPELIIKITKVIKNTEDKTEEHIEEEIKINYQLKFFENFKNDKFKWNKQQVKNHTAKLFTQQQGLEYLEKHILKGADVEQLIGNIRKGLYKDLEQIEKAVTASNDIFLDKQRIQILEGDMFSLIDKVEDNSIDLLCTDPPYYILDEDWDTFKDKTDFLSFTEKWLNIVMPKIKKDTGRIYISFAPDYIFDLYKIFEKYDNYGFNMFGQIIWVKKNNNQKFNRKGYRLTFEPILYLYGKETDNLNFLDYGEIQTNVWEIAIPQSNFSEGKFHPTQKPLELYKRIIETGSKINDLILDCFAGSGTTGIVCKQLNRKCILIEKDKNYIEIMKGRISNELG